MASSEIAATLSAMQAAATSQLQADQAAAMASIAAQSNSFYGVASPSANVQNAKSDAGHLEIQAGLGFLAVFGAMLLF